MKKKIGIGLFSIIALIVLVYVCLPLLVSQDKVSSLIHHHAKEALGRDISFDRLNVGVFPRFSIEITNLTIPEFSKEISIGEDMHILTSSVRADSLRFTIKIIPLLFKKVSISSIGFKNVAFDGVIESMRAAAVEGEEPLTKNVFFTLSDISGTMSNISLGRPITYAIEGNLGNEESHCVSKGTFLLTKDDLLLKWSVSETQIENGDLELVRLLCEYFDCPVTFKQGVVNGKIKVKQRGTVITTDNDLVITELVYSEIIENRERESIPFDCSFKGRVVTDLDQRTLEFEDLTMTVKDSTIKSVGSFSWDDEPSWDITVYSAQTSLDTLPLIFPVLNENLPYNVGFSGTVSFDIVAKRTNGADSFSGNFDLEHTLFSVTEHFKKAGDLPMHVNMQFSSDNGIIYEGDATVMLGDMNLKATITEYDVATQTLEGSFLTNNFDVDNWDEFFTVLKERDPKGTIKFFGAGKVEFNDVAAATYTGGVVFDSISVALAEDLVLRDIVSSITISDTKIYSDSVRLSLNDSRVDGSFQIRTTPRIVVDALVTGNDLDLSWCDKYFSYTSSADWKKTIKKKVLSAPTTSVREAKNSDTRKNICSEDNGVGQGDGLQALSDELKKAGDGSSQLVLSFGNIYILGNTIEDFDCLIKEKNGLLVMDECNFSVAEGNAQLTGTLNTGGLLSPKFGDFGANLIVAGLQFGKLEGYVQDARDIVEGTVDAEITVQGSGLQEDVLQSLKGSGKVIAVEGKLKKVDFIEILSRFDMFFNLNEKANGYTDFSKFEYFFKIYDGRIDSNHIKMFSSLYDIEGMGAYAFDGGINYRINVLFNEKLSKKLMPSTLEGQRFKVPVQIYNTVEEPKFSVERAVTEELINTAINTGINKLLGKLKDSSSESKPQSSDGRSAPIS